MKNSLHLYLQCSVGEKNSNFTCPIYMYIYQVSISYISISDKTKTGNPTIVQLAKGSVEEVKNIKGHDHVLKLTSTLQGERSVYLSFTEEKDYNKWIRKTKKVCVLLFSIQ